MSQVRKEAVYSISIVLPNYNGRELLEKNLPSLIDAVKKFDYEIIVVDDASDDDSVDFLKLVYPEVKVVESELNCGFSMTCNKGIHVASNELVCIANTDVTFDFDYFVNAIKVFSDPSVFAVKGDIINYKSGFDDVVVVEREFLLYFKRGFLRFNPNVTPLYYHDAPGIDRQFVLLGCCFVCRRSVLKDLGGYDEIYSPFYWEDSDLAQRALTKGWRLVYDNKCIVYHQTSATISANRSNVQRRIISNRNKFIFTWRHLSGRKNWSVHVTYVFFNLLSRWIVLDWKYYVSFSRAAIRIIKYR